MRPNSEYNLPKNIINFLVAVFDIHCLIKIVSAIQLALIEKM